MEDNAHEILEPTLACGKEWAAGAQWLRHGQQEQAAPGKPLHVTMSGDLENRLVTDIDSGDQYTPADLDKYLRQAATRLTRNLQLRAGWQPINGTRPQQLSADEAQMELLNGRQTKQDEELDNYRLQIAVDQNGLPVGPSDLRFYPIGGADEGEKDQGVYLNSETADVLDWIAEISVTHTEAATESDPPSA